MALSDAYATVAEYYAHARAGETAPTNPSDADYAAVLSALKATARYIDKKTRRPLGYKQDGTATQRVYFGCGGDVLSLMGHDYVSVSAIAWDSVGDGTYATTLAAGDYELLPRNAAYLPEPEPYRSIWATRWGNLGAWPVETRVRVTGIGGWPAVPEAIKQANLELCAILRIESERATNKIQEGMETVLGASPIAQGIIRGLVSQFRPAGSYV